MTCPGCNAYPFPEDSDPRRCAFREDGSFNADNWACETMRALRRLASDLEQDHRSGDDESIGVLETSDLDLGDDQITSGWLVMCWYKDRGRTGSAKLLNEDGLDIPLTLDHALAILRHYDGEVP